MRSVKALILPVSLYQGTLVTDGLSRENHQDGGDMSTRPDISAPEEW